VTRIGLDWLGNSTTQRQDRAALLMILCVSGMFFFAYALVSGPAPECWHGMEIGSTRKCGTS